MNEPTEALKFATPSLNAGEIYAGAIIQPDGRGHHVILLPVDNDDADWNAQMQWAKSIGGDLPARIEQALFFQNLPDHFQKDWYWSNTLHASTSDYAWYQNFGIGYQDSRSSTSKCRARAVRRSPI